MSIVYCMRQKNDMKKTINYFVPAISSFRALISLCHVYKIGDALYAIQRTANIQRIGCTRCEFIIDRDVRVKKVNSY